MLCERDIWQGGACSEKMAAAVLCSFSHGKKKKKIILLLYFYSVFSIPDEKRVLVKCFPKRLNTDLSLNHHDLSTI